MPAPGDQHATSGPLSINPFEEAKPRVSVYTAQEIATLQSRLEKQLGPEYISARAGPSGQKVHYIAAEKCIQLANEVFGFNGWSSEIKDVAVDFLDENPQTSKISIGISVIIRVTLRDGTFHEDIGYGNIENCKGKAAAFEKAKKEATTDALKRALKNFGNVLGNCIYDKDYLSKVTKIKIAKPRWDVANLHRHPDYVPPKIEAVKEEEVDKKLSEGTGTGNESASTLADEFGDFDDEDFSIADPDARPDEVVLPQQRGPAPAPNRAPTGNNISRPAPNQSMPPTNQPGRPPGMIQNNNSGGVPQQPQTPGGGGLARAISSGQIIRPAEGQPGPAVIAGRVLNQPSRMAPPSAASPSRVSKPVSSNSEDGETVGLPPPGKGFYSARAASMVSEITSADAVPSNNPNLPVFNPHLESPSIRKTPGVDHKSSKPITRDLKHVPGSSQSPAAPGVRPGMGRGSMLNPQVDSTRQIGAPGMRAMSPMQNRGSYKPPTIKRPLDAEAGGNRMPLANLPANEPLVAGEENGGDIKRQRTNV